jgi:serine/threonine protein kinase
MEESSERPWTNVQETVRDFGERTGKASSPLPTSTSMTSPDKYFSLYLTLAASITENAIEEGDPALAENLEKIDVYYLGLFAEVTEYIGRGLTYSVRRTKFENSKDVVFKSSIPMRSAKTLNGQGSLDADRLAALLLELRILTHPPFRDHQNIVNIIQVGWEGDALDVSKKWPVLVMEYADRGTLVDYFDENVSADFPTKLSLCANVTSGLQALHGCHVVHGDLKLENVLVFTGDDGQPVAKLSDFGGALLDSPNELSLHLGTPPWNAPEWRSKMLQEKLLKCDVYSLGLLLWRILLNGADPFEDESIFSFPQGREQRLAAIEAEKMTDSVFLGKVKASVERSGGHDLDRELVWSIFDCAIQLDGSRRNLVRITELLDLSFDECVVSLVHLERNGLSLGSAALV